MSQNQWGEHQICCHVHIEMIYMCDMRTILRIYMKYLIAFFEIRRIIKDFELCKWSTNGIEDFVRTVSAKNVITK